MKVLFFRYGSICEPDIIDSFREIGVEIYEMGLNLVDKSNYSVEVIEVLTKELQNNPVDFVFSINFFPLVSDVCNIFHIRYFSWSVDCPVMELFMHQISNEWNRTFIFDKAQLSDIEEYNPGKIYHLPLAANVTYKQKYCLEANDKKRQKFSHNVVFIGSLYSEKSPYDKIKGISDKSRGVLDGIIAAQEKVYGYYFVKELLTDELVTEVKNAYSDFYSPGDSEKKDYLSDKEVLSQLYIGNKITERERYHTFRYLSDRIGVDIYTQSDTKDLPNIKNHGTCDSVTEMPVIFNNSKININTTSKIIRTGIPLRVFDIMASGGFVLSNYQTELHDCFNIGDELAVYSSIEECYDMCRVYLENDSIRKEIAEAGFERIKRDHTYNIRLVQMIKTGFSI